MDLNSDIPINWSKRGSVFLQIIRFVCSLLLEYFKRCCVFLLVYKLAPLFLVRSSVAKNKDLEFRKEFRRTQSMEYLTSNKNLVNSVAIRSFEWLRGEA